MDHGTVASYLVNVSRFYYYSVHSAWSEVWYLSPLILREWTWWGRVDIGLPLDF